MSDMTDQEILTALEKLRDSLDLLIGRAGSVHTRTEDTIVQAVLRRAEVDALIKCAKARIAQKNN